MMAPIAASLENYWLWMELGRGGLGEADEEDPGPVSSKHQHYLKLDLHLNI